MVIQVMGCTISAETSILKSAENDISNPSEISERNQLENSKKPDIAKQYTYTYHTCVLGANQLTVEECEVGKSNSLLKMSGKSGNEAKKFFSDKSSNLTLTTLTSLKTKNKSFKFQTLPSPIQSESDKKEYKVIKLENGLIACLISDKSADSEFENEVFFETSDSEEDSSASSDESSDGLNDSDEESSTKLKTQEQKMAAAGLCIGVGSFSDPKDVQGMAHFLEHMVFMGSKKFPEENDFDSFIKKGGGSDNASTDAETTCFYFECLEKHLYEALDKFAQFFISPLMKKEAMGREREAIDSEFQMALPSDDMRKEQLLCSLAKSFSPVNSFGWGNLKTLRDNISDDQLYNGVHEFRKRHYSAHRMTLAIQARLPMETLQTYVLDCFCNVPNNNLPPDDFSQFGEEVFDTPEFRKIYYIKPNTDLCQLDLTWSLPCLQGRYKTKPHSYVAHLIGDEGKGSLLTYLKQKVWGLATSIGNGETGIEYNSMYCLFTVSVVLTKEGFENVYEVIEAVFSYINMLKEMGPQSRIFDEIKMIADTSFKFSTEDNAVDIVEDICEAMQFYPPEDYIAGSELYYEYSPKDIEMVMEHLDPEKMNIRVLSKTLPNGLKFDKIEPWFGTKYTSLDIPQTWLEKWKSVKPYPELDIPPPNPYLTTDFSILPEIENNPEYPQKIISTPLLEMWYRKDQKFKLPLAYYYFYLISPLAVQSPANSSMLDIILNMFVIVITEELYPATAANLSYSFAVHERGLMIKVSGYNEKLPLVIEVISRYLVTLNDNLTEDMFSAVKDKVIKSYHNKLLKPSTVSKDIRLKLLVSDSWTPVEKHAAILDVTLEHVKQFYKEYMKSLYVKTLIQGNVSAEVASDTVNKFVNTLQFQQLPENSYPRFKVVQVPNGEKCCRVQGFSKQDTNSVITNYYQSGPFSIRNSVIIEIIMLIIEEPLFDILRTKEQLGYSVYCSIRDTFGILGYTITVNSQATKFSTSYVDERIEAFLKHTKKVLSGISEEQLDQTKGDLIKTKQCADVHLKEEMSRNWSEIITDDYMFDKLKQEIQTIGDIQIEEIREWWDKHNVFGNQENYRKLSIQIVGSDKNGDNKRLKKIDITGKEFGDSTATTKFAFNMLGSEEISKKENKAKDYFVSDINKFREGLSLYPTVQNSH